MTLIILINIISSCPVFAASIIDTVTWKYKLDSNNVTVNDKNMVTAWGDFVPKSGEVIKNGDYLTFSKKFTVGLLYWNPTVSFVISLCAPRCG